MALVLFSVEILIEYSGERLVQSHSLPLDEAEVLFLIPFYIQSRLYFVTWKMLTCEVGSCDSLKTPKIVRMQITKYGSVINVT